MHCEAACWGHLERLEEKAVGDEEAFSQLNETFWESYWRRTSLWEWLTRVDRTSYN